MSNNVAFLSVLNENEAKEQIFFKLAALKYYNINMFLFIS